MSWVCVCVRIDDNIILWWTAARSQPPRSNPPAPRRSRWTTTTSSADCTWPTPSSQHSWRNLMSKRINLSANLIVSKYLLAYSRKGLRNSLRAILANSMIRRGELGGPPLKLPGIIGAKSKAATSLTGNQCFDLGRKVVSISIWKSNIPRFSGHWPHTPWVATLQ